jgi:branched-chain amino acid transport system ATP-binding protein
MSFFIARDLVKRFGALTATDHVNLSVTAGEVHALIGPNGAGKSTLVHLISGLLPADAGSLTLDGVELTAMAPHQRVAAGLSRCFQVTSIFPEQTVLDNLRLAAQAQEGSSFRFVARGTHAARVDARAVELAHQVGLHAELGARAGELPHGAQRKLDVALAIAGSPKLLLLDEPMAGMGPHESAEMITLIQALRAHMTIVLIEHDMDAVFRLADRISVLVNGRVLVSGSVDEIRGNPLVQDVYLGKETEEELASATPQEETT